MARDFPLWVCVLFPCVVGLLAVFGARVGARILGSRRLVLFAHYLGLGAVALCALFCVQGIELLAIPDDPRGLAHTPWPDWLVPGRLGGSDSGELRLSLTLVGDRLSMLATLSVAVLAAIARVFLGGSAGLRDLGLGSEFGPRTWLSADSEALAAIDARLDGDLEVREAAIAAVRDLGLLGLLEAGAVLVILASNLALGALGWALLGLGGAVAVARSREGGARSGKPLGDEARASAASRVLVIGVSSDLALGAAAVALVVAGIGLDHSLLWSPDVGLILLERGLLNAPVAELLAAIFVAAVLARGLALAWSGPSAVEAVLETVLVPAAGVYLLLRHNRILAFAPTLLAVVAVVGLVVALAGAGTALLRPEGGRGVGQERLGARALRGRRGVSGTGVAWLGLMLMALGVGSWRTLVALVLAHGVGRLGLRLALLLPARAELGGALPLWTGRVARVACWSAAAIAPGLGFAALAQTLVDVLGRTSLLGPIYAWFAAFAVLAVGFVHAAAVARLWYEELGVRGPAGEASEGADGLDWLSLVLLALLSLGLGLAFIGSWFGLAPSPIAWLDQMLPVAGGHGGAPLGLREEFREGFDFARSWRAGSAAVLAIVTGFAWMWTRDRFRRGDERALSGPVRAAGLVLDGPRKLWAGLTLLARGVAELAAQGVGRGALEEGPRVLAVLLRDLTRSLPRGPTRRAWLLSGSRRGMVGLMLGVTLVLGWLYAKPHVSSLLPAEGYGFGGLRPRLIRAGGNKEKGGSKGEAAQPLPQSVEDARRQQLQFERKPGDPRPDGGETDFPAPTPAPAPEGQP